MLLRRTLPLAIALISTAAGARAQDGHATGEPKANPATTPAASTPAAQDPDRPHQSPADRIESLNRELERLRAEITYVHERLTSSTGLLRDKFAHRAPAFRTIDAGVAAAPAPTPVGSPIAAPKRARVMDAVEAKALPEDVLMTVNGSPVTKGEIDRFVAYLMKLSIGANPAAVDSRATLEAIRVHTLLAAFPEEIKDARAKMEKAIAELKAGGQFDAVAKQYGSAAMATGEGKTQITRYCAHGLDVEMSAFAAKDGELVGPIEGLTGLVLLQVDKHQAGEHSDTEVVEARMLQIPYAQDPSSLEKQRGLAALGQVDVAVRNAALLEKMPGMLRPEVGQPPVGPIHGATSQETPVEKIERAQDDAKPETEKPVKKDGN